MNKLDNKKASAIYTYITRLSFNDQSNYPDLMPMILRQKDIGEWIKPDGNPQEISEKALTEMCLEKAG